MTSYVEFDEMDSTPQLSETQSQSVDGTEIVTQDFMVHDQLETGQIICIDLQSIVEIQRIYVRFCKAVTNSELEPVLANQPVDDGLTWTANNCLT